MIFVLIVSLLVIGYTINHKENRLHTFLLYYSICAFIYLLAYVFYCFLVDPTLKIHCLSIEFIVGTLSFTFSLFIVAEFFENKLVFHKKVLWLFAIVPLILIVSAIINPWTGLIATPINTGLIEGVTFTRGPSGMLAFYYGFLLYFIVIGYCIFKYPNTHKSKEAILLLILSPVIGIFTFVSILLNMFGSVNLIPLGTVICNIILFIAIFFTGSFNAYNVGFKMFTETTKLGMVFFDNNDKIIDCNPAFKEIVNEKNLIGKHINDLEYDEKFSDFYFSDKLSIKAYHETVKKWLFVVRHPVTENDTELGKVFTFLDISDEIKVERERELYEELNNTVLNNIQIGTFILNENERGFFSDAFYDMTKINKSTPSNQVRTKFYENTIDSDVSFKSLSNFISHDKFSVEDLVEYQVPGSNEHKFFSAHARSHKYGQKTYIIGAIQDITENVNYEKALIKSDFEKTVLVKDMHHRVKNNLQVIASFINLEERLNKDNPDKIIEMTKNRIKSLAVIHERIYNEDDMSMISIKEFMDDFDKTINGLASYPDIIIKSEFDDVKLSVDKVTPLTLMINELTTNSFKYAFKEEDEVKEIIKTFKVDEDGNCTFHYKDNGKGIPEDVDITQSKSLGWRIIRALSDLPGINGFTPYQV